MPRLSRPSAQIAYERIRIVEGETWLGIYPLPERKTWGFKRYARHNITDVKMLDGIAAAYLLHDPEENTTVLAPDIDYATEHGIPECIIRIADSEDPSVRAHPPVADAIEPARRLYDYYLGWSDGERELQKLLYTWEHDPQVRGVSEPDFDDDTGLLSGMPVANREGGTPTGAKIFQTAGRRSALSTTRELKQMVATALHLSEYHFGETRNSNRSNSRDPVRRSEGLSPVQPEPAPRRLRRHPGAHPARPRRLRVAAEATGQDRHCAAHRGVQGDDRVGHDHRAVGGAAGAAAGGHGAGGYRGRGQAAGGAGRFRRGGPAAQRRRRPARRGRG